MGRDPLEEIAVLRVGHEADLNDIDFVKEMQSVVEFRLHSETLDRVELSAEDFVRLVGLVGVKGAGASESHVPPGDTNGLFAGSPELVAETLIGKQIQVGKKKATITATQPQTAADNSKFIGKEPLFIDNPVDVYIAAVRGKHILFLRSREPYTCVRVTGIQIGQRTFKNASEVCQALGLNHKSTGSYKVDGEIIHIELEE